MPIRQKKISKNKWYALRCGARNSAAEKPSFAKATDGQAMAVRRPWEIARCCAISVIKEETAKQYKKMKIAGNGGFNFWA